MKYNLKITLALIILFLAAQTVGLISIYANTEVSITPEGPAEVVHAETVLGPRPETSGMETVIMILVGIAIGTGLMILVIRFSKVKIWKAMFFIAVFSTIFATLGVFIDPTIAMVSAFILAVIKLYKYNIFFHNVTEVLIYSGLALIFVPLLNLFWVSMLLIFISIYDIFAVNMSKHMVSIAKFQVKERLFAGLLVSSSNPSKKKQKQPHKHSVTVEEDQSREAILGGGDIAFPLIFGGVLFGNLVTAFSISKEMALLYTLLVPALTALMLLTLLVKATKGKYYPAMPFMTAGCFIAYGIVLLLLA